MEPNKGLSPSISFGSLLGGLFDQVNDTIQQAAQEFKNAGMELEIEAGQEIGRAIERVENCYRKELDYTIDKVKKEAKDAFDKLDSMVQKFQQKNLDELQDLKVAAQQLANTLPFSSKEPQLSSVKPRYIVISDVARAVLVTFKGNFYYSATTGFEPSLTFAGKQCYLVDSSTQSLTFQISQSSFEDAIKDQYSFRTGTLVVPYNDGWVRNHRTDYSFRVGLGALPQSAGKGSAEYISQKTERHTEHTTVPETPMEFNGNNWYPEHWHTVYQRFYPKQGWSIDITKAPILHTQHVHGDHQQEIESYDANQIVVKVGLYCKSGSDIGIVKIQVEFDQYLDQTAEQKRTEEFQMNWKDEKLLEPQGNEVISKVEFDNYNGVHQEFGAPDINSGTLKVTAEGNGKWEVWAEPPKDLQLKHSELPEKLRSDIATAEKLQHLLNLANVSKDIKIIEVPKTEVKTEAKAEVKKPEEKPEEKKG